MLHNDKILFKSNKQCGRVINILIHFEKTFVYVLINVTCIEITLQPQTGPTTDIAGKAVQLKLGHAYYFLHNIMLNLQHEIIQNYPYHYEI